MIALHWFLPTGGDSREVVDSGTGVALARPAAHREADLGYLGQVARAADTLGFGAVLTPTGTWCEDAWLTSAALLRETERLKFLVALRPGLLSPTLAAQMAATFQRLSRGRLLLNVVTGGVAAEQRRFGDWLDHDARYERTAEFLTVLRGAWAGRPFDFAGRHFQIKGAQVARPPDPPPAIYFGGASPAAERVAARHADVYLLWGEPPPAAAERLARVRALAAAEGRELRFGIRFHVISRDTAADAWAVAERLLAGISPEAIARAQATFLASDSVGQHRMAALHNGRTDQLEIYPNLWAGVGLVRGGAGTALVGSHAEVAARIAEYHALGFDEFILSGYPHLEEAYWVGEGVRPLVERLAAAGGAAAAGTAAVPAGERLAHREGRA